MIGSHQKSTGTQYTVAVASLTFALVFSPGMFLASGSFAFEAMVATLALSTSGLAVAWFSWKRYSRLTIPSIAAPAAPAFAFHSQP